MPLRFYRRFRAGPFRLNAGVSTSIGTKGAWFTVGHDHVRTSVGVPGSGLFWYSQRRSPRPANDDVPFLPPPTPVEWIAIAAIVAVIVITGWAIFVAQV